MQFLPGPRVPRLEPWFALALVWIISCCFFFSSRRRHTRSLCDWSSDVCSSDLLWRELLAEAPRYAKLIPELPRLIHRRLTRNSGEHDELLKELLQQQKLTNRLLQADRKSVV